MTLSIAKLCIECHYAERHYAECRISFIVMMNVIMLSVVMLNVVAPKDVSELRAIKIAFCVAFHSLQHFLLLNFLVFLANIRDE
jgi:hypothetical protein